MDSFMPCCSNAHPDKTLCSTPLSRRVVCWWLLGSGLGAVVQASVAAEAVDGNAAQFNVIRRHDGLFLSARLPLEISPAIEDVLQKGVPLHFLWQAQVIQSRWYWLDKTISSVARTVRLAYQPLTRRWRLSYATGTPTVTGLQYALHQNFDNLSEALLSAGQVSHWKLAPASAFKNEVPQRVEFSFVLDLSQLPRPFQLGLLNQTGWNITFQRSLPVPESVTPDTEGNVPDGRLEVES